MVDYVNALKYPFTNIKSFIIGALMSVLSMFLIPFLFLNGYLVKMIRATNEKSEFMPEWKDWKELLFDGVFVSAIEVAYLLPSLLLFTVASGTSTQTLASAIASNTVLDIGITTVALLLISSILMLFAFFIIPVAVVNYALTKEFRKAFDIKNMLKTIIMNPLHYLLSLVIGLLLFSLILATAPFLLIVTFALLFYPMVFFYRVIAEWFTELP